MTVEREPHVFSDEEMSGFKQTISTLDGGISPHAENLTQEEFRRIYRMGPQAIPFVEETIQCVKDYAEFSQAFLNVEKIEKNFIFSRQTDELANSLGPLLERLVETSTLSGAQAFATARAYFESVKAAAKANKSGADAILARLKKVYYRKDNTTGEKKQQQEQTADSNPESK